jgi:hypothetical protein
MVSWSTKRRWTYISVIAAVVLILIVVPGFFTFYKAPTCFDGIQNEGELGIDCGGPCTKLCQTAFMPAKIIWADSEEITPGTYDLAAYIENENLNGAAVNVPYTFSVYDNQGVLITQQHGRMTIPVGRNTLAFVGDVKTGTRVPAKGGITFQFDNPPIWGKSFDSLSNLVIGTPKFSENGAPATGVVSSLNVPIGNNGLTSYNGVTVYAVLSDKNSNHIGFSETYLDSVPPGSSVTAPFTWPFSFGGRVVSEEILPVVAPIFSGN